MESIESKRTRACDGGVVAAESGTVAASIGVCCDRWVAAAVVAVEAAAVDQAQVRMDWQPMHPSLPMTPSSRALACGDACDDAGRRKASWCSWKNASRPGLP